MRGKTLFINFEIASLIHKQVKRFADAIRNLTCILLDGALGINAFPSLLWLITDLHTCAQYYGFTFACR